MKIAILNPTKSTGLFAVIILLFISKSNAQEKNKCEEDKNVKWKFEVAEVEVAVAVNPHFGKEFILNGNCLFRYKDKFRINGFVDYNVNKKFADYTLSYDHRIINNIHLSATIENDFFGHEYRKDHFKIGVKTYLQDYNSVFLKKHFTNFSLDLGYSLVGTAEQRVHKPEFAYQILTKPIWLNRNEDIGLVLFSLGRIRTTTNVFIGQIGIESEKWHSVLMVGTGHFKKEFEFFVGFQYTLNHFRFMRCRQ